VGDEILSIDNNRITEDPQKLLNSYDIGDEAEFIVSRSGVIKTVTLKIEQSPKVNYDLKRSDNADATMKKIFNKWLVRN
jgi:hypothetical protein